MRRKEFRRLVQQALAELPSEFLHRLDNVAITIEDWPGQDDLEFAGVQDRYDLLGLYVGTPLPERSGYNLALPDRIILYQKNIEAASENDDEALQQIKLTVIHEVAHHFGITDEELERLGLG
jgi:predicted Zn-dependent protease with MMP-like domain